MTYSCIKILVSEMLQYTIYSVDDSKVQNFYVEDMLLNMDVFSEVKVIGNPREVLKELKEKIEGNERLPDLILLDIIMPQMNGFELLRKLEQESGNRLQHLNVFMVSSSQHEEDIAEFERCRLAVDFLDKPLRSEILENKIAQHFA